MSKKIESKDIDQLLAEADELIHQINSDKLKDLEEEHRLQIEKHVQDLENIRHGVRGRIGKKEASDMGSGAKGIHEAILDIVKAVSELKRNVS